jgi:uncharacterized protein YqhQ
MSKNTCEIRKKTSIGGQALLEGIMMRGPKKTSLAVRNTDGEIVLETNENTITKRPRFFKWPIFRGVFGFADSMICGYKALMRSAELSGLEDLLNEETEEEKAKREKKEAKKRAKLAKKGIALDEDVAEEKIAQDAVADEAPAKIECEEAVAFESEEQSEGDAAAETVEENSKKEEKKNEKQEGSSALMTGIMIVSVILALGLALVLFKVIPETLWEGLTHLVPKLDGSGYVFNILRGAFTGIIKIAILVGYMAAVSLMKDIKRTFMYHGAEHKTIFCYEQGLELTVENVRNQRRFHPRCGTSFLILMLLVSIFVSIFIPAKFVDNGVLNVIIRTGIGLLTLPIIMGVGYELIKFAGRHDNLFTRVISAPGVWLQHITTKEPTDDMIECAIAAMNEVIPSDDSDAW